MKPPIKVIQDPREFISTSAGRALFVHEFGPRGCDGLLNSLMTSLVEFHPKLEVFYAHGLLKSYRPGGYRLCRLLNAAWVYGEMVYWLLRKRPGVLVVGSTPPMLQHWAAFWGPLMGANVVCWILDYHPEIEARALEHYLVSRPLAYALRRLDSWALRRMSGVVVLDEAMAKVVKSRVPDVCLVIHPTWTTQGQAAYQPIVANPSQGDLRLVHIGNLGFAHSLNGLENLLQVAKGRTRVRLLVVGASQKGQRRFEDLAQQSGTDLESESRLPLGDLRKRLDLFGPGYGLVLLRSDAAGLVSPSKFITYLQLGIPLLYIGPQGTNSDLACCRFGAGISLTEDQVSREPFRWLEGLLDPSATERRRNSTQIAFDWFASHSGRTLTEMIAPWLPSSCHQ